MSVTDPERPVVAQARIQMIIRRPDGHRTTIDEQKEFTFDPETTDLAAVETSLADLSSIVRGRVAS